LISVSRTMRYEGIVLPKLAASTGKTPYCRQYI
jgi:hypothetical protein